MSRLFPSAELHQQMLRGVLLLVICALGGTFDILNNNFSRWVARMASFPEEEEVHAKDRAALVAAAQPSRRGNWHPNRRQIAASRLQRQPIPSHRARSLHALVVEQTLLGAGIFQHC